MEPVEIFLHISSVGYQNRVERVRGLEIILTKNFDFGFKIFEPVPSKLKTFSTNFNGNI